MRLEAKPALGINPEPTPGNVYLTLLTSMFMHGGLAHLFGNNLEYRMWNISYFLPGWTAVRGLIPSAWCS